MRLTIVTLLTTGILLAVACVEAAGPDKKGKPHFTIGKDTTCVTEPVDKDGYIDFATALNKRLQQGVTPDNNANVLLWRAFGPHPEKATMPPEFFQWLGAAVPPEQGDYFVDLFRYLDKQLQVHANKQYDWVRLRFGLADLTRRVLQQKGVDRQHNQQHAC